MTRQLHLLICSSVIVLLLTACGQPKDPTSRAAQSKAASPSVLDSVKKAAEAGDAKAQLALAKSFDVGDGIDKDQAKAFEWFLKSAEAGNVDAMVELAERYDEGKGTKRDWEKGQSWWKKAAEGGNAAAQHHYSRSFGWVGRGGAEILGKTEELQQHAEQLIAWLTKAAAQNHLEAKYQLGMTYFLGATELFSNSDKKIVQPDMDKGLPLIKDAAEAGYWEAQRVMAILYQSGFKSIKPDKEESEKYWKKFAEQTDPVVQRGIGLHYSETDRGKYQAGKNKYQGRSLSFEETNKVAFEWFQKAADKNDTIASFNLATMYRDGRGVWKDDQKAIDLFRKASDLGHFGAQQEMANAYLYGKGVVRDYAEAYKWLLKAAAEDTTATYSDVHRVRNALGVLHEFGWGVEKDAVLAYAWYNIAAAGQYEKAKQNLARVEKALKPDELREAQTLSREWTPGKVLARASTQPSASPGVAKTSSAGLKLTSMGSGFYVSKNGNLLTNHHVIDGCAEIRVPAENGIAKPVVTDKSNDLALIKLDVTGKTSAAFPDTDDLKQGEEVYVFGFPLDGYLPSAGNITPGIVSALAGPGNNSSLIQITAPVQPGNSGGPLLNKKGKVVGVVVGKADAIRIAKVTGDIPQNINFAIAPRTVKSFLDGNQIEYQTKGGMFSLSKNSVEIADEARKVSVKVECWR